MGIFEKEGPTIMGPEGRAHLDRNWGNGNEEFDAINKRIENIGTTVDGPASENQSVLIDANGKKWHSLSARLDSDQTTGERALQLVYKKADKDEIEKYLSQINYYPETFKTLSGLKETYPNGKPGIFIVASEGNFYYYDNGWIKGGTYQGTGIAENSISEDKLNANLRSKVNRFVSMFRGKIVVNWNDGTIKLSDYDFTLQDMRTHFGVSKDFNSSVVIPTTDMNKDMLYLLTLNTDGKTTILSSQVQKYDTFNDDQYILGYLVRGEFHAPFTNPDIIETTNDEIPELIINDHDNILIDKQNKKVTVINKTLTLTKQNFSEKTFFVDQGTEVDFSFITDDSTVALVYDFDEEKLKVVNFRKAKYNAGLIAYFRPQSGMFQSPSGYNCFEIIEKNGKGFNSNEIANNYQLATFNDIGNITLDFNKKEITYRRPDLNTITTLDYLGRRTPALEDIDFSTSQYDEGKLYVLCATASTVSLYLYNTIPAGAWILASFRSRDNFYHVYGNQMAFVIIGTDGKQIYPEVQNKNKEQVVYDIGLPPLVKERDPDYIYNNVGYTGRWIKQKNGLYTTNLGSKIYARIHGSTKATISFDNLVKDDKPQYIAYRIDDGNYQRVAISDKTIEVSLPDKGYHYLSIATSGNKDADNVWSGGQGFKFKALTVDAGEVVPVTAKKKIAFIGDSITAGCWVTGDKPSQDYRGETTYAAISAQLLQADDIRIAYSLAGVEHVGTGNVPNANSFINNVDKDNEASIYNADMVVVNLGTNDNESSKTWVDNYNKLLNQVNARFAGAKVVLMVPFKQKFAAKVKQVGKDRNLLVVDTAGWNLSYTNNDNHPDQAGQAKAGKLLAQALIDYI